jgi:hypothetical protein
MIERIPLTDQPERNPGPYEADRHCGVCSAVLSRNNPGPRCAPCQLAAMPEAELVLEAMNRVTDAMDITPMPTVEDMYPPAA